MELNVLSLINGTQTKLEFEFPIESNDDNPILPPYDVTFVSPLRVKGIIAYAEGCMELTASCSVDFETHCSRCGKNIARTFDFSYERTVVVKGVLQNEEDDSYVIAQNGYINIDEDLVDCLLVEFPFTIKCKDDCLGVCSKCGQNFNDGQCSCSEEKEIDPRFKDLLKLINNED